MDRRTTLAILAGTPALVACRSVASQSETGLAPTTCTTLAACNAHDGERIVVAGIYRHFPDVPGIDYSAAPRAVRITLEDGLGPFLDPFWSPKAIRPQAELARFLGKLVRVTGRYHKSMPSNPNDPPQASAMGGPCIEVESIEAAQ